MPSFPVYTARPSRGQSSTSLRRPAAIRHRLWDVVAQALLAYLPERSYHILVGACGLDDQPSLSLDAIGQLYGLSRERIRQIGKDALVVLCLPALSGRLRRLCDQTDHPLLGFTRTLLRDMRDIPAAEDKIGQIKAWLEQAGP